VRDVLDGMFEIFADKFWVSSPSAINRARLRPLQLRIARECGLNVPDSVITNNPKVAIDFCNQGKTVFKPLSGYCLEYDDVLATAFTTLITEEIYENLHLIKNQHALLQRYVAKSYEIRVTCVGRQLFPVKISSKDLARTNFSLSTYDLVLAILIVI
jgi:glutathione synthase/RimK-type ligase-like ATP-grasp enzyme